MNRKILFNDGWKFAKSSLETENCDKLHFEDIDIPHDWLIYNTLDLYENSIGWYKKKLKISKDLIDKEILLWFDGVYMNSSLYINNEYIGDWKYGYSSFEHNITKALREGENEILLKVIHENPNSRWYSGAGIYRNVYLKIREKNHIETNGIYVVSNECEGGYNVNVNTELHMIDEGLLKHTITRNGEALAEVSQIINKSSDETNNEDKQKLFVENPLLWCPENPNLYELKTELYLLNKNKSIDSVKSHDMNRDSREYNNNFDFEDDFTLVESVSQRIGFKKAVFDHDKGLILNGIKIKLNGVCEHHDLGALGSAFNKCALKRRFKVLKEMGVNAIRTSHNMPAPELMDLADEMGLLILSESFDMWERSKTTYDYARFFDDNYKRDVKSWVTRDRNHPCLLMWSIGNEIYDTHADERGQEVTKMLMDEVLKYDPYENAKVTLCSNYMPWENAQKCADIVKIAGYNYGEAYYDEQHAEHEDWVTYGSETASVVQSRGVYHFPFEKSILAEDDEQCSALGNSNTSWGADSHESCIIDDRDRKYSLGQFIWTGFDYIGEPTPYHTKNSYFGQIDTAGFKKDSYYIYQAEWTDYKKKPLVHIFPYWDFNKGQIIDIRICSNAPLVELFVNDKCIGVHHIDHKNGKNLVASFKVPYEEGEIKAVAYDEKGNELCEDIRKSFKDSAEICLKSDKNIMTADGRDLIFIDISMKDEDGNPVYNADNRVNVKVTGPGRLIGLDNGDSTDYDQYKGTSRRLFNGKLMAIIGSTFESGQVTVEVSSKGMNTVTKVFESISADNKKGISAFTENKDMDVVLGNKDEIPVRKIEISSKDGQILDENKKEIIVEASIYPFNASYNDVNWSIVSDGGIPTNIAVIESLDNNDCDNLISDNESKSSIKNNNSEKERNHICRAKVKALGDGEFRVRCTSNNGGDKVRLISELEFKAEGLGEAYKNPYEFVCAGLYDHSVGEVGNGNEKGVSTSRTGATVVGFHNIDFGLFGSDTITMPIFALNDDEYSLQIYEGMPDDEGSILLADTSYQKESIWNVYQEETYKLSKKLKGITSISFVLHDKVHVKGFYFEKKNRAFEVNHADESDSVYGDTFKINDKYVEGIGNNVSLVFDNMDFGADGISSIQIYGRSPIDKNSINILFEDKDGNKVKQLIEFTHSDDYEDRVFNLDKISGIQKVTFVFLPGCNFDFGYFKFMK